MSRRLKRLFDLGMTNENSDRLKMKKPSNTYIKRDTFPTTSFNQTLPIINGKTVSYEQLLGIIALRFHECLKEEA